MLQFDDYELDNMVPQYARIKAVNNHRDSDLLKPVQVKRTDLHLLLGGQDQHPAQEEKHGERNAKHRFHKEPQRLRPIAGHVQSDDADAGDHTQKIKNAAMPFRDLDVFLP